MHVQMNKYHKRPPPSVTETGNQPVALAQCPAGETVGWGCGTPAKVKEGGSGGRTGGYSGESGDAGGGAEDSSVETGGSGG